jgi:hypothetical protein
VAERLHPYEYATRKAAHPTLTGTLGAKIKHKEKGRIMHTLWNIEFSGVSQSTKLWNPSVG